MVLLTLGVAPFRVSSHYFPSIVLEYLIFFMSLLLVTLVYYNTNLNLSKFDNNFYYYSIPDQ